MTDAEDFSSLPLTERATHKIWKVRLAAYDEMTKQFTSSATPNDSCFQPYLQDPSIYVKIVKDSNVVAQEAGLSSLLALLQYADPQPCLRLRSALISTMAEKALSSARQGTKKKCIDVLLMFIELDTPLPVIEELIPILSHKLPKLVASAAFALRQIIENYGIPTIPPKLILAALPPLFSHGDKNVRAEAFALTVELHRWLGDQINPLVLPSIKPVQQKELQELFTKSNVDENPTPQRFLRSELQARQDAANNVNNDFYDDYNDINNSDQNSQNDSLDLVDPVDIKSKIDPSFYTNITSSKWKERKEALDALQEALNVPKIKDDDFTELISILAKCVQKDANIMVVTGAANSVQILADGLKSNFARYKSLIVLPLLERLKERKQSVLDALSNALDAVFSATSFSSILEDTLTAQKHKTPQIKIESANFLIRCLKTIKSCPDKDEISSICKTNVDLLSDTQEPVRNSAAEVLGTIMKITGERLLNPYLKDVDEIRVTKVKGYFEKAEVKAKYVAQPPPSVVNKNQVHPQRSNSSASNIKQNQVKRSLSHKPISASQTATNAKKHLSMDSLSPEKIQRTPSKNLQSRILSSAKNLQKRTSLLSKDQNSSLISNSANSSPRKPLSEENISKALRKPGSLSQPTARGLAHRSLASKPALGSTSSSSSSFAFNRQDGINNGLSNEEKLELDELRKQKEQYHKLEDRLKFESQQHETEKLRLLEEITTLQARNSDLLDENNSLILKLKGQEAHMIRLQQRYEVEHNRVEKLSMQLRESLNMTSSLDNIYASNLDCDDIDFIPSRSPLRKSFQNTSTKKLILNPNDNKFEKLDVHSIDNNPTDEMPIDTNSAEVQGMETKPIDKAVNEISEISASTSSVNHNKESSKLSNNNEISSEIPNGTSNGVPNGIANGTNGIVKKGIKFNEISDSHLPLSRRQRSCLRQPSAFRSSVIGKENGHGHTHLSGEPLYKRPAVSSIVNSSSTEEPWKRAAEVTNQLKERIYAMRAKHDERRD